MNNISKKTIVISIILLLIGVSVSSATTNVVIKNLIDDNQPPNTPDINGPTEIPVGVEIDFIFSTLDPDGDNVSYYIKWGDGTSYGWTDYYPSGQDITIAHTWDEVDWFNIIRCKAKDTHGKESDWAKTPIRILKSKDCGCNKVSDADLVKVERLLDRVEVYSKLLLVLSRYNPDIQEEIEELLDLINFDFQWFFPIICFILEPITFGTMWIAIAFAGIGYIFSENPILKSIFDNIAEKIAYISTELYEIGEIFGCWQWP